MLAPHEADGTMSNGANGNHGADHSDYCEHAPKLKEQLSKKSKHPSAIPGSFYERDLAFKSAAFTERKKVIPPRYKGECEYVKFHGTCMMITLVFVIGVVIFCLKKNHTWVRLPFCTECGA